MPVSRHRVHPVLLLASIMAAVVLVASSVALKVLYDVAFQAQGDYLTEIVESRGRMLEAVARFNRDHDRDYPGGAARASLAQLVDATERDVGFGRTGEFAVARRDGDHMLFVLPHRHLAPGPADRIPLAATPAEPMRRALRGEAGSMVGPDYRGETVLAAYAPVAILDLGLVAKVDLAEIRAPFIAAGIAVLAVALAMIAVGTYAFFRIAEPMVRGLTETEALREGRESLARAQAIAHLGSWDWNIVDGSLAWSDEVFRIFGLVPQSFTPTYEAFLSRVLSEDRASVVAAVDRSLTNPRHRYAVDHRVVRPDGTLRIVQEQGEVQRGVDGRPLRMIGTIQDITERRRIEDALQKSQEALVVTQFAVDRSADMIFRTDPAGRFLYVNDEACRRLGFERDEMLAMGVGAFNPGHGGMAWDEHWRELRKRKRLTFETTLTARNGETFPVDITANHVVFEGEESNWAFVRDITDRREREEAQRESEERFRATFEQAAVGMALVHPHGRFLSLNDRFCDIAGYPKDELLGKTFQEITHPDDLALDLERLDGVLAGEAPSFSMEKRYVRKDRRVVWVNLTVAPMRDAAGTVKYLVAVIEDITRRKHAEREIAQLNAELEKRVALRTAELAAANNELEAFSYSVAHDLRAPLSNLDGFGRILDEEHGDELSEDGRRYLRWLRGCTVQMNQRIDHYLALAQTSRTVMTFETVDLSDLAQRCIRRLRSLEPDRQVRVEIAPEARAVGDQALLWAVLENLLGNAWKFTRRSPDPEIRFDFRQDDGETVFFVADNGVGFDPTAVNHLFQPFQRLHNEGEFEGSGIGLATVQRIVHRHGGRIWVTAAPGQGATFQFTIPDRRRDDHDR